MLDNTPYISKNLTLFDHLSDDVSDCLRSRARVRHYRRGQTICLQDEPARTLKVVIRGCVKLYRVTARGDEAIVETLLDGHSFDEIAALHGGKCQASAEAINDCEVMHLSIDDTNGCPEAKKEITEAVLMAASQHMNQMISHIEELKACTAVQRLSGFLVDLDEGQSGVQEFELPFDKNVLAGKLGMQPESLSRAFKRLKSAGVESVRRKVTIADFGNLRDFASEIAACP